MSKEPNKNVYVGHRYVPKIMGEWDNQTDYEGLSVVIYQGNSYTSKKRVPFGIDILNEEYWVVTGNYNVQVEQYREETERVGSELNSKANKTDVSDEFERVDSDLNTKANETDVSDEFDRVDTALNTKANKTDVPDIHNIEEQSNVNDYTDIINNALNNHRNILFKKGDYNIDVTRVDDVKSNTKISFEPDAVIHVIPNELGRYEVFNIVEIENVVMEYPNIIGDKHTHLGNTGQWGHAINIDESKNIKIIHPTLNEMWGDGIYIRRSENIVIDHPICDDNRRQGISLISGKDIFIHQPRLTNTSGHNPGAGIDIEPNWGDDHLINVHLYGGYYAGNGNEESYDYGIVVSLHDNNDSGDFMRTVDVTIHNPYIGEGSLVLESGVINVGHITVIEPYIENAKKIGLLLRNQSPNLQINVIRPRIINNNRNNAPLSNHYNAALRIINERTNINSPMQNIYVESPYIESDIDHIGIGVSDVVTHVPNFKNVQVTDAVIKGFSNRPVNTRLSIDNLYTFAKDFEISYDHRKTDIKKIDSYDHSLIGGHQNSIISYESDIQVGNIGLISIMDNVEVNGADIYIENRDKNKQPLHLNFTDSSRNTSKKYVNPLSSELISTVVIENYGGWIKMKKVSNNTFEIIDQSPNISAIV